MFEKQENYASFLLRLRQVEQAGRQIWRVSLESVQTGERKDFANLPALFVFLHSKFGNDARDELETVRDRKPQ